VKLIINDIISSLESRLPELEWKSRVLGPFLKNKSFPRGMFKYRLELTPKDCIDEIKQELEALKNQPNEHIAHYMAMRIHEKINVLVKMCKIKSKTNGTTHTNTSMLHVISNRDKWLKETEDNSSKLLIQRHALKITAQNMQCKEDLEASSSIRKELDEIERKLSL
jgi:primosomal protein N''